MFNLVINPANKVEDTETLETLKTNLTKRNIFSKVLKKQPLKMSSMRQKLLSKLNQLNQSLNNPKLSPLNNTTKIKELKSIMPMRRRLQPKEERLMPNG